MIEEASKRRFVLVGTRTVEIEASLRDVQVYAASRSRSKVSGGMLFITATQIITV